MQLKNLIKNSHFKFLDGVIIVVLILLSFLPIVIFSWQQVEQEPGTVVTYEAVLTVDGKEINTFPLEAGTKKYTYRYTDADGDYNLIEVDGDEIRIVEANCGDQVCVQRGAIKKARETIVCLPHKLLIEVVASDGNQEGNVIY
ncbi:NusG domain II-containing protein [Enterococcus timonensis]|uniref:NusG domain II-containing protein n=1 Tax=Enterococcus timonensis TaxID=1852364 RepID=UPI0008D9E2EC|nr:NusG domain II-containing protein [Enterococcus timonensis]